MKLLKKISIFAIAIILLIVVGFYERAIIIHFSGDGIYEVKKMPFPFGLILQDDSLTLQNFPLDKEGSYIWHFEHYCSLNPFQVLFLANADKEIPWWKFSAIARVIIKDDDGQVVFERNLALNSFKSWPHSYNARNEMDDHELPLEWITDYPVRDDYLVKGGEGRSQLVMGDGIPKKEHDFIGFSPNNLGCLSAYTVNVQIKELPDIPRASFGHIKIQSGWK